MVKKKRSGSMDYLVLSILWIFLIPSAETNGFTMGFPFYCLAFVARDIYLRLLIFMPGVWFMTLLLHGCMYSIAVIRHHV